MLSAGRTGFQKLLTESCACAVYADPGIGRRDVVLRGKVLHALLSKIDGTEGLGVLRLQAVENAVKAGADLILQVSRCLD